MYEIIDIEDAIITKLKAAQVTGGALEAVRVIASADELNENAKETELGLMLVKMPAIYVAHQSDYQEGGHETYEWVVAVYASHMRGALTAKRGAVGTYYLRGAVQSVIGRSNLGLNILPLRRIESSHVKLGDTTMGLFLYYETSQAVD